MPGVDYNGTGYDEDGAWTLGALPLLSALFRRKREPRPREPRQHHHQARHQQQANVMQQPPFQYGYPQQPYPPQQGYPPAFPPQQPYPPQQGYPPQQPYPPQQGYPPPYPYPPPQRHNGAFWQAVTAIAPNLIKAVNHAPDSDELSGIPTGGPMPSYPYPPPPGFPVVQGGFGAQPQPMYFQSPNGQLVPCPPGFDPMVPMNGYGGFGGYGGDDDDDIDDVLGYDPDEARADDILSGTHFSGYEDDGEVLGAFGATEQALEKQLAALDRKIDKKEDKSNRGGPFVNHKKIARDLDRLKAKRKTLSDKLNQLKGKKRKVTQAAAAARQVTPASRENAAAMAAAATTLGAGALIGSAGGTRAGAQVPYNDQLWSPAAQAAARQRQANDGVRYNIVGPPGSGRLNVLPMYASASDGNPRNALTIPVAGITAATALTTEDIPYAEVKITGFQASVSGTSAGNGSIGLVKNYRCKGTPNLFLHDGAAPASNYDTALDRLTGLRWYPNLKSPNQATVDALASGDSTDVVIITANAVVDVVADDNYGAGLVGPTTG